MTTSSRNRKAHKERSQLAHRARLGILEKHKDYVQRARDYHRKQDHLRLLRQKAASRNKDEFYFSMVHEKTRRGVHSKDRGNTSLPVDVVKVLKTQDENYLRTMRAAGLKKIDRLKTRLTTLADLVAPSATPTSDPREPLNEKEAEILAKAGLISPTPSTKSRRVRKSPQKHIVFVENEEEVRRYAKNQEGSGRMDVDAPESTPVSAGSTDLGWKMPSSEKPSKRRAKRSVKDSQPSTSQQQPQEQEQEHEHRSYRTSLLKELGARLTRDTQLRYATRELEMQRLLMGKGARRKLCAAEKVDGGDAKGEDVDEDELDAMKGRRPARLMRRKAVDMATWKPRVYKWKSERKR